MKKTFKILAALALVVALGIQPLSALANPSSWAVEPVNKAIALNLVPQELQSNYTQPATRAEFCALAVALYESVKGEITDRATFVDTNDVNVEKAAAVGIVSGIGDNMFAPSIALSREQAAVMLAQLAQAVGKPLMEAPAIFFDSPAISTWAVASVGQVQFARIMGGTGKSMFSPKDSYTREQCIITIVQAHTILTGTAAPLPAPNSLPIHANLKKGMTDAEFTQAYNIAYDFVKDLAGLNKLAQVNLLFYRLASFRHGIQWEYSMETAHYSDVYGFFVLHRTSCAGDVRAAALCLTILGIPYEHVNENKYEHQWTRANVDGVYFVLDVNAPWMGYELKPYEHPKLQ